MIYITNIWNRIILVWPIFIQIHVWHSPAYVKTWYKCKNVEKDSSWNMSRLAIDFYVFYWCCHRGKWDTMIYRINVTRENKNYVQYIYKNIVSLVDKLLLWMIKITNILYQLALIIIETPNLMMKEFYQNYSLIIQLL